MKHTFGSRLAAFMDDRKLDDVALGLRCGKSSSTISRIRRDLTEPRRETIIDIARALRVSPLELFDFNQQFIPLLKVAYTGVPPIIGDMTTELFCQLQGITDPYVILLIDRLIGLKDAPDRLQTLKQIRERVDFLIEAEDRQSFANTPSTPT